MLYACSFVLHAFWESCCSASPLRGRGPVCSEYLRVCTLLYEPISRRSLRFEQSCKSVVSREEETTCSRRTTKPKRRRQTTKSGGFNSKVPNFAFQLHEVKLHLRFWRRSGSINQPVSTCKRGRRCPVTACSACLGFACGQKVVAVFSNLAAAIQ